MSSKTKIVVLKSKELIYTGIFVVLGIMLILLLFYMFSPGEDKSKDKKNNSTVTNNNEEGTEPITVSPTTEAGELDESITIDGATTQESVISETENLEAEISEVESSEAEDLEAVANLQSSQSNEANTYTETTVQDNSNSETFSGYVPGVYTSELNLGGSTILLSVSVDESQVTGVSMDNMDETLTAMYPLVQPSLDEINSQIGLVSSMEDITYSADNKYTTILILDAIDEALEDARK